MKTTLNDIFDAMLRKWASPFIVETVDLLKRLYCGFFVFSLSE
ncbi:MULTISPECIES: hypothetical protein [Enterococcus]|nr:MULTISPECIES: hypothetical protein [Enterococcus]MCR1944115.1 hypothetical protein [Enterococcus gallinarum]